jgi:hypothetical protein
VRSGLPLLTFAGVASLAAVAGSWAVDASQYGRYVALVVLALFVLTLANLSELAPVPPECGPRASRHCGGSGRARVGERGSVAGGFRVGPPGSISTYHFRTAPNIALA